MTDDERAAGEARALLAGKLVFHVCADPYRWPRTCLVCGFTADGVRFGHGWIPPRKWFVPSPEDIRAEVSFADVCGQPETGPGGGRSYGTLCCGLYGLPPPRWRRNPPRSSGWGKTRRTRANPRPRTGEHNE